MSKFVGVVVLVAGLLMIITGFIVGQSGVYVPDNVLGLYSPLTAICVYGGAVVAFCGFAIIAAAPKAKSV